MSGVGGGGFMQILHAPSGEHNCIDYCGTVPARAAYALFADNADAQNCGPSSPLVPGSAAGWLAALARYGSQSAAEVFAPAIELAEGGFALTKKGSEFFVRARASPDCPIPSGHSPCMSDLSAAVLMRPGERVGGVRRLPPALP